VQPEPRYRLRTSTKRVQSVSPDHKPVNIPKQSQLKKEKLSKQVATRAGLENE